MQVNATNAMIVAQLFARLSVERFKMRTIDSIIKDTDFTEQQVKDVALAVGAPLRHRIADGKPLIERPDACTPEQAGEIAAKAKAIVDGSGEPFEVSFIVEPDADEDEDAQFL